MGKIKIIKTTKEKTHAKLKRITAQISVHIILLVSEWKLTLYMYAKIMHCTITEKKKEEEETSLFISL